VEAIPERFRDPLAMSVNANLWAYNGDVYDSCPISNVWELTEPEWKGRIALVDPLTKGTYADWFNQMQTYGEEAMREAYQDFYGHDFAPGEFETATQAWVAGLARSGPLLAESAEPVSEAIGTAGDTQPF